jgi:hypothetical protein
MHCEQAQLLLDAYADGELRGWTRWQIARHLAGCEECRTSFAKVQELEEVIKDLRAVTVPKGLSQQVLDRLPFNAPIIDENAVRRVTTRMNWRQRMISRPGVMVAICGSAALAVWLLGLLARPTNAFEQVVDAMTNVHAASWQETDTIDTHGQTLITMDEKYARLEPPAIAWHSTITSMQPSRMGYGSDDNLYVQDEQNERCYNPIKHVYTIYNCWVRGVDRRRLMQSQVYQQMLGISPVWISIAHGPKHMVLPSPPGVLVQLDGRKVIRFDEETKVNDGTGWSRHVDMYWADPVTHLLVRSENDEYYLDSNTVKNRVVKDHFEYNKIPSAGTFDLTPPAGVTVQHIDPPGDR